MKKKFLLVLVLLFAVFLVAGCDKDDNNTEEGNKTSEKEEEVKINEDDISHLYSDNNKLVFSNGIAKLVYYYKGDTVIAYYGYFEYSDAETANAALEVLKSSSDEYVDTAHTKDNYLIVKYKPSTYESTKASQLKTIYSAFEEVKK